MWFVEAEFLVCTSFCLQLQLSLSKQVLYQMVTCNCFGLSLLNCPFLRSGQQNFHGLCYFFFFFFFFLSGNIQRPNVEYSASGKWVYNAKSSRFFLLLLFWFLSLYGMDFKWFSGGQLVSSQERRGHHGWMYWLEHCPCSLSMSL